MRSQKQLILGVVRSSPEHMTAEEIHSLARRERGSLALGTVYRNLTQLEQEGQIRRLEVPGQPLRFDRTVTPHGHLLCPHCGRVRDLEPDEELREALERAAGGPVQNWELQLSALCEDCRREETQ